MISNVYISQKPAAEFNDFTVEHYRKLLCLARSAWNIVSYKNVCWERDFLLWRHDVDLSLNRSLALAQIEAEEGVKATYFVDPHSKLYNLAESGQVKIVNKILSLGHDLGLHFDASFYDIQNEKNLDLLIERESNYLEVLFSKKPVAFSFHNPVASHLACEAEEYGGLVNCYSKRFKAEVAYCSDSNGYWRFRRLYDVLNEKKDYRLQVLTHPEWWQEKPMPARQRFFRCVYGRANANMQNYDEGLVLDARVNQAGPAAALRVFRESQLRTYELCDYLWNSGAFQTLFLELWRLHEAQIKCLCTAQLCKAWEIPAAEVNGFFASEALAVDGWRIFEVLFETNWQHAAGMSESAHKDWVKVRNQLIHGRCSLGPSELEQGCVYLCGIVHQLATWGVSQPFAYDGLTDLGSIGIPISETAEGSLEEKLADRLDTLPHHRLKRWRDFLGAMPRLTEY